MGERISTLRASALKSGCQHCSLSNLCLPLAVSDTEIERLEDIVQQGRAIDRGKHVFRQRDPFRSCFAVRSGAVKTYIISGSGEEQITGFYLPGEIIGLDSMTEDGYSCSAKALERSSLCEIPFDKMEELAARIPSLQHHFFQLMSREIKNGQNLSLLLSKNSAEERIASLLLSLSSRFSRRRLSATQLSLPMPRHDIANYLGLAVETVSRVMTRFHRQGLIESHGREVSLLDIAGIQAIAHGGAQ
ncbi:fumarate/nitrate reduction transcriptional regulator Fnr [Marinobacter sp. JSM 1782161]|uniref:fumarate/nitrate reduction transcriptional regulator Fnr n=1 Tax=Marinobacter sp. JSM 1782161 TaxID=2685906 RepID=UPI001402D052|nr:fumarate/nitrate reduction transcriptional regulator Fnr [Marinobacter sp. JSM 1782161]